MTCHRVHKLIPLAAGDDLRPRLARAVRAHLESCPACRTELREYQEALSRFKATAEVESALDWSDGEWRTLMARVAAAAREREARGEKKDPHTPVLRPRWAAASVLGAIIGVAVLSVLFRDTPSRSEKISTKGGPAFAAATREQDVVALTMVSQETGLQVVWFFDKNFDWKGDKR